MMRSCTRSPLFHLKLCLSLNIYNYSSQASTIHAYILIRSCSTISFGASVALTIYEVIIYILTLSLVSNISPRTKLLQHGPSHQNCCCFQYCHNLPVKNNEKPSRSCELLGSGLHNLREFIHKFQPSIHIIVHLQYSAKSRFENK